MTWLTPIAAGTFCAALAGVACEREARPFRGRTAVDAPQQAGASRNPYAGNAWGIAEGKRLYTLYNCVGCHANGGGGMGPALIDEEWRYGSSIEQIYGTIAEGRPNGMPSFRGKVPEQQIWQLAAYVRSLGGFTPQASSSRKEAMRSTPPRNQVTPPEPEGEGAAAVQGTVR
jgi:cytochrome c oxidase cbb3-type subunit 3